MIFFQTMCYITAVVEKQCSNSQLMLSGSWEVGKKLFVSKNLYGSRYRKQTLFSRHNQNLLIQHCMSALPCITHNPLHLPFSETFLLARSTYKQWDR